MPAHLAAVRALSPNGRLTQANGAHETSRLPEFAELSNEAAEPCAAVHDRGLQCDTCINRIGASP